MLLTAFVRSECVKHGRAPIQRMSNFWETTECNDRIKVGNEYKYREFIHFIDDRNQFDTMMLMAFGCFGSGLSAIEPSNWGENASEDKFQHFMPVHLHFLHFKMQREKLLSTKELAVNLCSSISCHPNYCIQCASAYAHVCVWECEWRRCDDIEHNTVPSLLH